MSDDIDWSFRPQYFGPQSLAQYYGSRVKGELRRRYAADLANSGEYDEEIMSEALSDAGRSAVGAIHPSLMGGEYLPDFLEGEIEVARVVLQSTTMDVISLRARREGGEYAYRIVDEYETEFDFTIDNTYKSLSMLEIVGAINKNELVTGPLDLNLEGGALPSELCGFVSVTSSYYPGLMEHYERVVAQWIEENDWDEDE